MGGELQNHMSHTHQPFSIHVEGSKVKTRPEHIEICIFPVPKYMSMHWYTVKTPRISVFRVYFDKDMEKNNPRPINSHYMHFKLIS